MAGRRLVARAESVGSNSVTALPANEITTG